MQKTRIRVELRALNNSIRRYFEFSIHGKEIKNATGNHKWIIHYLVENEGKEIYQKDIETHFNIARSTVSKVLTLMEQKGLIQKLSVEQDARLKQIILTDEARKIQALMCEDAEKMEETLIKGFSEEELQTLLSYLQRMRENLS
ncbi:MarR family transcriptional regulator [Oscillospiraceae bacterium MB08-C2-2]|nr:MarR family transcriptional regulator [Oscillospiraceae bacterium MB08-C2-2]